MSECWAAAVALAAEDPPADLRAAIAEELVALWSDLGEAMRRAGRSWSVECDGLVVRIVMLSRLSGMTSWEWIPELLLASGVYQGILRSADLTFTQPCPVGMSSPPGQPHRSRLPATAATPGRGVGDRRATAGSAGRFVQALALGPAWDADDIRSA